MGINNIFGRLGFITALGFTACGDDKRIADDFCHGESDGTRCDDGSACTVDDRCGNGLCLGRPAIDCSAVGDGVCQVGACDPETVTCIAVPANEGQACDDGALCTSSDRCVAGTCVGEVADCDGGECETSACDPETGACVVVDTAADGTACAVADPCNTGLCDGGSCQTTPVVCDHLDGPCERGVCSPEAGGCTVVAIADNGACDDGNPCSTGETCVGGVCGGATFLADGTTCTFDDLCLAPSICASGVCDAQVIPCPEPPACFVAICDPETGSCSNEVAPDGAGCDDRDACTEGETCTAGVCGGGSNLCFCRDKVDGTPCDDGQRCTANDICQEGACLGRSINCSSLDDGRCIEGSCDPETGACVPVPRPLGSECDDGLSCTDSDRCVNGRCVGEQTDCSALDGGCVVGLCSEATNGCAAVARPDDTRCDDGVVCSGGDVCTNGVCVGGLDICGECEAKSIGESCDDGDPCTVNTICVARGGARVCEGTPKDCSGVSDACNIGVCDAGSGECRATPRAGLVPCDDGDACTEGDACNGGVCAGNAILTCGAQVSMCEPPVDNDTLARAVMMPAPGASLTVVGWIDIVSEVDWWAVTVPPGRRVTLETRSHCRSDLDTVMGVYRANGDLIAEDDNSGANNFSRLTDILTETTETLFIGVTAYRESGIGSYLLTVTTEAPPPCRTDNDCACRELTCVLQGADAGRCVPRMPYENEPNGAPAAATALAIGGEVFGDIDDPSDVEWFEIDLRAGEAVSFRTRPYCVEGLETQLGIYAEDGATELGFATANGFAGHADIETFTPTYSGRHFLRLESAGATVGRYVLTATSLLCTNDSQCSCEDEVCGGSAASPGRCVPGSPSVADMSGASVLEVGGRLHGAIENAWQVQRYTSYLAAGRYDITTHSFCGSDLDTLVEVWDANGVRVARDDDSGMGFFSAVTALVVPVAASYEVRVMGAGPGVGAYIVTLDFSSEIAP